jgi:hypothetical protein
MRLGSQACGEVCIVVISFFTEETKPPLLVSCWAKAELGRRMRW